MKHSYASSIRRRLGSGKTRVLEIPILNRSYHLFCPYLPAERAPSRTTGAKLLLFVEVPRAQSCFFFFFLVNSKGRLSLATRGLHLVSHSAVMGLRDEVSVAHCQGKATTPFFQQIASNGTHCEPKTFATLLFERTLVIWIKKKTTLIPFDALGPCIIY